MPGIVPALKARDHIGALAQPVYDFAFAFVAPLRADYHHIGHDQPLFIQNTRLIKQSGKTRVGIATRQGNANCYLDAGLSHRHE